MPGTHWPDSLAEMVSSKFSGRPCLKTLGGEQLRKKTLVNDLCYPHADAQMSTHRYTNTHTHMHVHSAYEHTHAHKGRQLTHDMWASYWAWLVKL